MPLPVVCTVRHGETEWSLSGQHTGITDLAMTEKGEADARTIPERLPKLSFVKVFTSPLQRARRTCELAGFGGQAEVLPEAIEWNYGRYEGVRTRDIHKERPGWDLFRDGCPEGESAAQVGARADRVIARIREAQGNVILFSSAHFLRVFGARWLGLDPTHGRYWMLGTAAICILGYEHDNLGEPVIRSWNLAAG